MDPKALWSADLLVRGEKTWTSKRKDKRGIQSEAFDEDVTRGTSFLILYYSFVEYKIVLSQPTVGQTLEWKDEVIYATVKSCDIRV